MNLSFFIEDRENGKTSSSKLFFFEFVLSKKKPKLRYFDGNFRFRNDIYGPIDEDVVLHIDTRTGKSKYRWGAKMFYMPHGLTIDHDGNFWMTDIGTHQVYMFKPNDLTHPAVTVGEMFQPGSGPTQLCRPADVAVMKNGDFFVADGFSRRKDSKRAVEKTCFVLIRFSYCNSRIIKFNRKGEYVAEWGSPMNGVVDSEFNDRRFYFDEEKKKANCLVISLEKMTDFRHRINGTLFIRSLYTKNHSFCAAPIERIIEFNVSTPKREISFVKFALMEKKTLVQFTPLTSLRTPTVRFVRDQKMNKGTSMLCFF